MALEANAQIPYAGVYEPVDFGNLILQKAEAEQKARLAELKKQQEAKKGYAAIGKLKADTSGEQVFDTEINKYYNDLVSFATDHLRSGVDILDPTNPAGEAFIKGQQVLREKGIKAKEMDAKLDKLRTDQVNFNKYDPEIYNGFVNDILSSENIDEAEAKYNEFPIDGLAQVVNAPELTQKIVDAYKLDKTIESVVRAFAAQGKKDIVTYAQEVAGATTDDILSQYQSVPQYSIGKKQWEYKKNQGNQDPAYQYDDYDAYLKDNIKKQVDAKKSEIETIIGTPTYNTYVSTGGGGSTTGGGNLVQSVGGNSDNTAGLSDLNKKTTVGGKKFFNVNKNDVTWLNSNIGPGNYSIQGNDVYIDPNYLYAFDDAANPNTIYQISWAISKRGTKEGSGWHPNEASFKDMHGNTVFGYPITFKWNQFGQGWAAIKSGNNTVWVPTTDSPEYDGTQKSNAILNAGELLRAIKEAREESSSTTNPVGELFKLFDKNGGFRSLD
jgi:hypothetical protein